MRKSLPACPPGVIDRCYKSAGVEPPSADMLSRGTCDWADGQVGQLAGLTIPWPAPGLGAWGLGLGAW